MRAKVAANQPLHLTRRHFGFSGFNVSPAAAQVNGVVLPQTRDGAGCPMSLYLIGFAFHEPEPFADWSRGLIEDYESSTGLFVEADSPAEAIVWGEEVAQALLRQVNQDDSLVWKEFGYPCWVEESPTTCCWSHCLDFFLRVRVGEMPNLGQMGTAAYSRWQEAKAGRTNG